MTNPKYHIKIYCDECQGFKPVSNLCLEYCPIIMINEVLIDDLKKDNLLELILHRCVNFKFTSPY